jgi:rubrerythrin
MAAIVEDDKAKILRRINDAETAVAARAVELFSTGDNQVREQRAMENAMYFLRLLRKLEGRVNGPCEQVSQMTSTAQQAGST